MNGMVFFGTVIVGLLVFILFLLGDIKDILKEMRRR